jgi:predicted nucleic acid-binding Zn ribbon protein
MSKTQHDSIKTVGFALDELVNSLGIRRKIDEYDAVVFWDSVVGKQIAARTTAMRITQGVLFVHVKTGTWRNELTLRKKEIINKLNAVIGVDTVRDIKFH